MYVCMYVFCMVLLLYKYYCCKYIIGYNTIWSDNISNNASTNYLHAYYIVYSLTCLLGDHNLINHSAYMKNYWNHVKLNLNR